MSNQEEVIQTDQGVACVYYSGTYKRYVCDIMKPKVERKTFLKREKAVEFARSKVGTADPPKIPPTPQRTSSSSRWDILRQASRSSSSSSASSKSLSNSS